MDNDVIKGTYTIYTVNGPQIDEYTDTRYRVWVNTEDKFDYLEWYDPKYGGWFCLDPLWQFLRNEPLADVIEYLKMHREY